MGSGMVGSGMENQAGDEQLGRIRAAVGRVVVGKEEAVEQLLVALLCRGHALLEDVPGVGKTLLARSLAATMACSFRRIQFTPDVLPSDVTGSSVFDQRSTSFEFRPGPIFTQILLADEINRATPRAQSALLEAMEERQVTVDGETRALPRPFLVLATQNPVELEGTFPLPEAQLDRFLVRVTLGYPSAEEEDAILRRFERDDPFARIEAVVTPEDVASLQERRGEIEVSDPVRAYLLDVVRATRTDERVALGASPRAALALHRASQARALVQGRPHVLPDDVKALARPVLAHRLLLTAQARLRGDTPEGVIAAVVDSVAVPVEDEARLAGAPRAS
ncbi:MAG: MoxR family ATPase [Acidimicrobiaceae bacterium]|nr:MoxR family ATPase [Acidimicrobiaceae bacterium]